MRRAITTVPVTRRGFLAGTATMAGAFLAACGAVPVAAPEEAPKAAEPEAKEAAPKAAEVTEVVWACYNLGEERNKTLGDMEAAANDVLQGERVTLTITPPGTNLWEKLQTEFAGGQTTYDIVVNQINWVQVGAARGLFASMNEQMARDNIAREEFLDTASWLFKNKLYALPFQVSGELLFYNKAIFDKEGMEHPTPEWTWDDVITNATKLTERTGDKTEQWGYNFGYTGINVGLGTFMLNNGGQVLNEARDRVVYGEDQFAIGGAQVFVDFILKHKIVPWGEERGELRTQGGGSVMGSGVAAMDSFHMYPLVNVVGKIGDDLGMTAIPSGPAARTVEVHSNSWSILGLSKVLDAAWNVMKVIAGEEGQTLWTTQNYPGLASVTGEFQKNFPGLDFSPIIEQWQQHGRDFFITPDVDAWRKAANAELTPMYTGEKTVPEAVKASADAANAVLAERPDELK
ncbi:MAG: extracellular solute-binding protein [Chloroflexota bacterium]|nr:extracellular solute-binding protein [Chloroflexota bacterium]